MTDDVEFKNVDVDQKKTAMEQNQEYFDELKHWLNAYNSWYEFNKLMYQTAQVNHMIYSQQVVAVAAHQQAAVAALLQSQRPNVRSNRNHAQIFGIPALWKRLVAEAIDFLILFFIKFICSQLLINTFNILPLKHYDFNVIQKTLNSDFSEAIDMTVHVFVFELIYRAIVCAFEAYFLSGGPMNRGGATPGKSVMGLRVISATVVEPAPEMPPNVVIIYPGTNLGFCNSLYRALIKNSVLMILFPLCFLIFFANFNRTGYDVICHSMVVEPLSEHDARAFRRRGWFGAHVM